MASRYICERARFQRRAAAATRYVLLVLVIGSFTGCAPYGGAPLISARSERPRIPGYRVESVDIVSKKEGAFIHGRICRTPSGTYQLNRLSVEHLDRNGSRLEAAPAYIYGMTGWRWPACGYYSAQTGWTVDQADIIRVGRL